MTEKTLDLLIVDLLQENLKIASEAVKFEHIYESHIDDDARRKWRIEGCTYIENELLICSLTFFNGYIGNEVNIFTVSSASDKLNQGDPQSFSALHDNDLLNLKQFVQNELATIEQKKQAIKDLKAANLARLAI